ncbi:MAG: response regulator [Chloroflexi bacterium]|nr:MAG: response regulator [Chloroflexota bacterium]
MKKEARVLIVEDDPFAESWMALLLARDWRTRVVAEASGLEEMLSSLNAIEEKPNFVVLNLDLVAGFRDWSKLAPLAAPLVAPLPVLLIARSTQMLEQIEPFPGFSGCVIKSEIRHALSWAVALAEPEQWVITPGIEKYLRRSNRSTRVLVLDGRKSIHHLTEHEAEVARMALIFSMERRELSDEIKISEDWSYGLVSSIYQKLGLAEIFSGEVDPAEYLGKAFAENLRFQDILRQASRSHKKNDLETLAFHILCMPEIRELD